MFDERFLLFKTDSLGEVEWYKYQDSVSVNSDLWAVDITKTGNYVGFGITQENPEWHQSGAIVMYDETGDTLWSKQYAFNSLFVDGEKTRIFFNDGKYTRDNSLIAAGCIQDPGVINAHNPIVVKTNLVGDTLWTWRLFNVDNTIVIESIDETNEGDYIAVGRADLPINDNKVTWAPQRGFIVKLSPNGELIFLKEWTDIDYNYFTDVAINSNNELVISGVYWKHPTDDNSTYHTLLVKTDSIGETIFYKQIEYGKNCAGIGVVTDNSDNICLMTMFGAPEDSSGVWGFEVLLQKYYDNGNFGWEKSIGGVYITNWPYAIVSTNDDGFAFCGLYSIANDHNYSWVVKTDSLGNGNYQQGWINSISKINIDLGINIYPNPVSDIVTVETLHSNENFDMWVYDLSGRNIMSFFNISEIKTFSVKDLLNGIYIIKIKSNDRVFTGKLSVKH